MRIPVSVNVGEILEEVTNSSEGANMELYFRNIIKLPGGSTIIGGIFKNTTTRELAEQRGKELFHAYKENGMEVTVETEGLTELDYRLLKLQEYSPQQLKSKIHSYMEDFIQDHSIEELGLQYVHQLEQNAAQLIGNAKILEGTHDERIRLTERAEQLISVAENILATFPQ